MKLLKFLTLFVILIFGFSCKKESPVEPENEELTKDLSGTLELVTNDFSNYEIISELGSSSVDSEGGFAITSHSVLMAVNTTNDKPVYYGFPEGNTANYELSAKETALYFTCLALSHIRRPVYKEYIGKIKQALYELQEVKDLEQAIKASIHKNGYLNYDEIGINIGIAVDKVISEFNFLEIAFEPKTNWNTTYAAGRGFYRVSDQLPDGWQDKYDTNTNTHRLKREFFNSTAGVIGVKIAKYTGNGSGDLPSEYVGFIPPYYPPNLLTVNGNLDNLKQVWQTTADIFSNGWNGLVNTDATSNSMEFEFDAKKGEKDAFAFVNGYYDDAITNINALYVFIDNFENIFNSASKDIQVYTNKDILNDFMIYQLKNNSVNLFNYATWLDNRDYHLIINDVKQQLHNFLTVSGVIDPRDNYLMNKIAEQIDKQFENLVGPIAEVYKYSKLSYAMFTAISISNSPKYAAIIPIEFDGQTFPPYPYQPVPFNTELSNVSNYNFQWSIDNPNNQNLTYNLFLGEKTTELNLVASSLTSTNYNVTGLQNDTRYYWQVEVINPTGEISTGAIWTFDNGIPAHNGDVILNTQAEVDDFGSKGYFKINGSLKIENSSSDITDLSSLATLSVISGDLVIENQPLLTNTDGLNQLEEINNNLFINDNAELLGINLIGLKKVNGRLVLRRNNKLNSITISNLSYIDVNLEIAENQLLNKVAVDNLTTLNGTLWIAFNAQLTDISANKLVSVNHIEINTNDGLNTFTMNSLLTINGHLWIIRSNLIDLEGIKKLNNITGELKIYDNFSLSNLCGLTNLIQSNGLMGTYIVSGNAYNPTQQDILNGNCSQ